MGVYTLAGQTIFPGGVDWGFRGVGNAPKNRRSREKKKRQKAAPNVNRRLLLDRLRKLLHDTSPRWTSTIALCLHTWDRGGRGFFPPIRRVGVGIPGLQGRVRQPPKNTGRPEGSSSEQQGGRRKCSSRGPWQMGFLRLLRTPCIIGKPLYLRP